MARVSDHEHSKMSVFFERKRRFLSDTNTAAGIQVVMEDAQERDVGSRCLPQF